MSWKKSPPPGGLEPPTFRLTAERASRLRHGGTLVSCLQKNKLRIPINVSGLPIQKYSWVASIRYGLVVRIPGSHPGGPGSIPGNGNLFRLCYCHLRTEGERFVCTSWTSYTETLKTFCQKCRRGWDSNPRVQSTLD